MIVLHVHQECIALRMDWGIQRVGVMLASTAGWGPIPRIPIPGTSQPIVLVQSISQVVSLISFEYLSLTNSKSTRNTETNDVN